MTEILVPLADRLIVEAEEGKDTTPSGLFIPESAVEKPQRATVISAGPGRYENGVLIATTVKAGDTILYGKYTGTEIKMNGKKLLILREADVLAIVRTEPTEPTIPTTATLPGPAASQIITPVLPTVPVTNPATNVA